MRQGGSGGWSSLVRDVQGVQGLQILYNAFSEEFERRLWALGGGPGIGGGVGRFSFALGGGAGATAFPRELFQVGLMEGIIIEWLVGSSALFGCFAAASMPAAHVVAEARAMEVKCSRVCRPCRR